MRVLAVDTSSNTATVAVMEDELLLGEYTINHKKTHSQKIMVMISQLLSDLELTIEDIDVFAAAAGPGSFTGLRIGVETVKALAHASGKQVVGVGTLEALAYNLPYAEHIIVPVMDARKNRVYTASYIWDDGELKEIGEPEGITIEECIDACSNFIDTIFVGDGVMPHKDYIIDRLGENAHFPNVGGLSSASAVAALAMAKAKRGEVSDYISLKPVYLKKSQAEQELEQKFRCTNDGGE